MNNLYNISLCFYIMSGFDARSYSFRNTVKFPWHSLLEISQFLNSSRPFALLFGDRIYLHYKMPRVHKKKGSLPNKIWEKKNHRKPHLWLLVGFVTVWALWKSKMALPSQIYSDAKNEDVTFAPRRYEKVYSSYSELSGESRMALKEIQKCLKRVR